ncbi:hypothetical protein B0T11DRAFT_278605 [Plectosphaerella cucumerina]|uniref:Nucleotide-diphospho-sugar transferase domain-containing protein n=1 Tax=Plectosphaerella cucumerina TaxID=40658 RepID=A0A8K0X6W8_9PEZI|nr:hypothetical protein B0T11DRAFT_278605 [Plectosphaerella cucumerina]
MALGNLNSGWRRYNDKMRTGFSGSAPQRVLLQIRYHLRNRPFIFIGALVFSFACLLFASRSSVPWAYDTLYTKVYSEYPSPIPAVEDFSRLIAALWKPYVHPLDNLTFTTDTGAEYAIPEGAHLWQEPLGKDLLILDVDTRIDNVARTMGPAIFKKENMTPRAAGILNHYIYSQIHGYDYKFVRAPPATDRHNTWVKVPVIQKALKEYRFVVFLDADAVFVQPNMPIEWLMGLWNITDKTMLAMAEDPNSTHNQDAKGWVLWNTGFVVAQASERTQELFDVWNDCPLGNRFPECRHWAYSWAHEQAAFGNHIRYAYNKTDELRALPCSDANGAPYVGGCRGRFVSHFWMHKEKTIDVLHNMVGAALKRRLRDGQVDQVFDAFVHPLLGSVSTDLNKVVDKMIAGDDKEGGK